MPPIPEPRCSGGVSEIGTLLWRLLEASTRLEMSKLLEDCLELGGASRNGGADPQVLGVNEYSYYSVVDRNCPVMITRR